MVIAISSYTEPIPVNPIAVNDLPQVQQLEDEKEERPEHTSFAELLAGLLNNSEKTPEVPVNENLLGDLNSEFSKEAMDGVKLISAEELSKNLSDKKAPSEFFTEDVNVLLGQQRLLSGLDTDVIEDQTDSFYQGFSNLIRTDLAPEADLDDNFFDVMPNKNNQIDASLTSAAAQGAQGVQEALAETRKDRAQKSSDNDMEKIAPAGKDENSEADIRVRPENEKLGKLEEMRNSVLRDRPSRNNVSFEVNDMRTDQNRSFSAIEASAGRAGGETAGVREITLELRLPEQNNAINQANTSWEAKSGSALENLLARELHQNFNGDIVRHASIALKDGGEGIIKLALKPESLGKVKIALELSDNKITGKIVVESQEALNAFRKEIASLEQAFKDSGFASADLDLSLTSGEQNAEVWEENSNVPPAIASRYDNTSEQGAINIVNVFIGHRKGSINMLA
ncbi:MAG: flagellar hook-length control protein FliK [Treponema sp.]|nr:flagellar hook-length control protein FliK [Treponema sp.]